MVSHERGVWASITTAKAQRRCYFVLHLSKTLFPCLVLRVVDCGRLRPIAEVVKNAVGVVVVML
jgi:hypothetical protein